MKLKNFNYKFFFSVSFIITAFLAIIFFKIPENYYIYWLFLSLVISIYLFNRKFVHEEIIEMPEKSNKLYLPL